MRNAYGAFVFSGQHLTVDKANGQLTELLKIKIYKYGERRN